MHSWDNWRGTVLHETPLQDGECAARLLSYYRVPKTHSYVQGFVSAMRDEETLKKEFSYIPLEIPRYENRLVGLNNGNSLMALGMSGWKPAIRIKKALLCDLTFWAVEFLHLDRNA